MKRRWRTAVGAVALAAVALAVLRAWPQAPLAESVPVSQAVYDRNGALLRMTLAADQQYRLWTPLAEVSPQFIEALLLYEDRRYYWHPGVDPAAILRATGSMASGGRRQGASTVTMQLARRLGRLDTRSVGGKLRQIAAAVWLELRYSKREILEAHLNLLPYGQNIQGVAAASRIYFGKAPAALSLAEALTLAVIPQSPRARNPAGSEPPALVAARQRLFDAWQAEHPGAVADAALATGRLGYSGLRQLPFEAPHLVTRLLAQYPAQPAIRTTLDLRLQRLLERRVAQYVAAGGERGLRNAVALLVDHRDGGVRALVGSAAFGDAGISGQVNGVLAKRSPGSALKPFIYGLALDQGLIQPLTVLKDAPASFGVYSPENFDGAFTGPVTARDALIRSRNVPAVALAARLAQPTFYQFLRAAGISRLASERHYGLALALGGGEVTMEELAALYTLLPNQGLLRPLHYRLDESAAPGLQLLSPEASFLVLDMLQQAQRPGAPGSAVASPVAWKTGTSWGFRDAWCVGVFGPYVLAVWIGNFDGSGNPAFVGIEAAAPLFFSVVDAVRAADPGLPEPPWLPPPGVARVAVCAASGDLPNADCPRRVDTWYIPGRSPIRVSNVHRRVRVDVRDGRQACPGTPARFVREEVFEFWPSDLMRLYAQAGMPRRRPPAPGECGAPLVAAGVPPQITSPLQGAAYQLRGGRVATDSLQLQATADGDTRGLYWFVDGAFVGESRPSAGLAWAPGRAGAFEVTVVDDHGRSASRVLRVEIAP